MKEKPTSSKRIVAGASRMFFATGFHRVSMDALAGELGMSKKTLYTHFRSKDELVEAVLRQRVRTMEEGLTPLLKAKAPFREKVARVTSTIQSRLSEMSPLFFEDIRRYTPECFHIVEEFRGRVLPGYFGQLLDEGVRSGDLRGDVDRALLVRLFVAAIQGIIRPEVIAELELSPQEALGGILDIIFCGVLTPKGHRNRPATHS